MKKTVYKCIGLLYQQQAYIHTYIIGHYNPLVRIFDLVSHTTYVVCVNFLYISGGTYSLKSTLNDEFFLEKLFIALLIYSQSFCQRAIRRFPLSRFLPKILRVNKPPMKKFLKKSVVWSRDYTVGPAIHV